VAAVGQVTVSRFSPSVAALVPAGGNVATAGNGQVFTIVVDATNAAYSAVQSGYVIAAGVASLTVPVVATMAGAAGNVQPGAISLITSPIAGVDTVTNALALTGGADAETDAAFRARFGNYLASLSRATNLAIGSGIAAIQQGLSYTISENLNQAGGTQMGHFVVTVDDGSGSPPASLLSTVQQAVEAVRPVGTSFAVQGPVVMAADLSASLTTATGASHAAAVAAVAAAWEAYVAALPVGAGLSYTRLAQLAYDASSTVTNISGLLINGGTADLVPGMFGAVRAGTVAVS
jgi:uncharacterized phage protein gp47/JayE